MISLQLILIGQLHFKNGRMCKIDELGLGLTLSFKREIMIFYDIFLSLKLYLFFQYFFDIGFVCHFENCKVMFLFATCALILCINLQVESAFLLFKFDELSLLVTFYSYLSKDKLKLYQPIKDW